jgi:glycosyltransferase involved in cell wall biosynthesis
MNINQTDCSHTNDTPLEPQWSPEFFSSSQSHLVSVVIPAFNAEATIHDTLRSVRSQTHLNLEIIVVDDGSTDRTGSIVESHASSDPRVTLISQANAGVAAARNVGWRSAHSDLIAFLDADDLWAPSKIEKQLEVMLSGGESVGLVYTWFCLIDEQNRIRAEVAGRQIEGDVLEQALTLNFIGNGSSTLIRRRLLIEIGGYDTSLRDADAQGCEDMQLYYRIARKAHYGLVPEHLTGYRVVVNRMSSDRLRMFRSFSMVVEEMKLNHPDSADRIDAGTRFYMRFLVGEALAFANFPQVLSLLSLWSSSHGWDSAKLLSSVIFEKLLRLHKVVWWQLRHFGERLERSGVTKDEAAFSIGELGP